MKKYLLALVMLLSTLLVPLSAAPAHARCAPPEGRETIYVFRNKSFTYYPTNLRSNWVVFRKGGSITYQQTKTLEVNGSMTATVEAEAGVIFAKASASLGVTVGASKSKTQSWSYTANVPADRRHKYRLHAYHYTANFSVMKKHFVGAPSVCNYRNSWGRWQRVTHAPSKADRMVWRLDKAPA